MTSDARFKCPKCGKTTVQPESAVRSHPPRCLPNGVHRVGHPMRRVEEEAK